MKVRKLVQDIVGIIIVMGGALGVLVLLAALAGIHPLNYLRALAMMFSWTLLVLAMLLVTLLAGFYIRSVLEEYFPDRPPR